jgi:predicted deacylase
VTLVYGGGEFAARLDGSGSADVTLDCFAGNATPVEVRFQDETSASAAVEALDLDKVSKIAILWRADANLDLHAFEYAAAHGGAGHVSPAAASSLAEVRARTEAFARGHGFLSSVADAETSAGSGDRVEVYTFLHREGQSAGQVAFAVDYETRGAMPASIHCGDGALASVPFRIVTWSRRGIVTREAGAFAPAACGAELAEIARFATTQLPALRARW